MDGHGMNPRPIAVSTRIVEDYPIDLDFSTGILQTGVLPNSNNSHNY